MPPGPKRLRVIGFDDAPFPRRARVRVHVAGVVCAGTRFEGMLWGTTRRDGFGATDLLLRQLLPSKYLPQLHLVLLDGIAFGGLNVVDLPKLAARLEKPCIAVMRREPNLAAMEGAIRALPAPERRLRLLERAGPIHRRGPFVFQVHGLSPDDAHEALSRVTDVGHVPEALRLAHLIGSAFVTGQSRGGA